MQLRKIVASNFAEWGEGLLGEEQQRKPPSPRYVRLSAAPPRARGCCVSPTSHAE